MRLTVRRTDYTTLYINIQFVYHREFIVLQLKRPIDECRTRKFIAVYRYNRTEHINTLCGQSAGTFSVKPAVRCYVCVQRNSK